MIRRAIPRWLKTSSQCVTTLRNGTCCSTIPDPSSSTKPRQSHLFLAHPRTALTRHKHGPESSKSKSKSKSRSLSIQALSSQDATIFALSTPPGRSAIAIIRLSGPSVLHIYHSLCPTSSPPLPRTATIRTLYTPDLPPTPTSILDPQALILYFPSPFTSTGEDVLELHIHGSPAVIRAVLASIPLCSTAAHPIRHAEPGEFTRRAFLNDRLSLTQVEALSDTLAAETEQQRRLSVRGSVAQGKLAGKYEDWRRMLVAARGELEALIDFSEDQHFDETPGMLLGAVARQVRRLKGFLEVAVGNAVKGEMLREGISVALLGAPNVGKSSLLNRVVGREAAIVSSEAGTTRDVVEVGVDVGGFLCRLADTAGLRARLRGEVGVVEVEGMKRAVERARESDVVLVVVDLFRGEDGQVRVRLDEDVCLEARRLLESKDNIVVIVNKADVARDTAVRHRATREVMTALPGLHEDRIHFISCIAGQQDVSGETETTLDASSWMPSDPGGIQALLRGLVRQFERITAAVMPDDMSFASPTTAATTKSTADLTTTATTTPTTNPHAQTQTHLHMHHSPGTGSASAMHEVDPSMWLESLGASARHRSLLADCISHLDAFLAEAKATAVTDVPESIALALVRHRRVDDQHPTILSNADYGLDEDTEEEADLVLAAEHLRSAADCLARITGKGIAGDVEEVLGVVFEKFCVGK